MELFTDDYVLGYWIASDKKGNDWYCIIKKSSDGVWHVQYTFRYNKSTDAWDGKDEKSPHAYTIKASTPESVVLNSLNKLFEVIKLKYADFNDHFLVQGDSKKFVDMLKNKDYMHMKMVN